jgi:hypothetical protein
VEDNRQKVLLIKELISKGYKDKHICMIAQAKQPYVSKIRNNKIQGMTVLEDGEALELNESQEKRLNALNKIINLPEIFNSGTNHQDILYIQVLKFFMVDKEDVYNLYFHLSKRQFRNYWVMKDADILDFDSTLIGIEKEVYLDLIIDYFI